MTHLSFTTSRDVLEALINCMQSPGGLSDSGAHFSASAVFTFSMESGIALRYGIRYSPSVWNQVYIALQYGIRYSPSVWNPV